MSNLNIRRFPTDTKAQTKSATELALKERVDASLALIIGRRIYVDTIQLLTDQQVSRWLVQRLRETSSQIISFSTQAIGWRQGLRIHQPSDETIACLIDFLPKHIITRCDLSIDLLTKSQADADTLRNELKAIITQPWRGYRTTTTYQGTAYYGPSQTRRNLVIYSDRLKRGPAAHIELRFFTAAACRQRGITHAMDFAALDLKAFLQRDFRLSALHWKVVDKLIEKEAHRCAARYRHRDKRPLPAFGPSGLRHRLQRMVLCQLAEDEETPSWADLRYAPVQAILDAAPFIRDAAVHIPGNRLLNAGVPLP